MNHNLNLSGINIIKLINIKFISEKPNNLTIEEEDSQHIVYGYLNQELKLSCTVIHGIPNGKLVWMANNNILEEKTTALLVYSFKAKQEYHLKNYTCATKSDIVQYSMERTVQLFVYSKYLCIY